MNNKDEHSEDYRSLLVLDEISRNEALTQRALSKKLGVALGLVNSYIKNLASKGYITVSAIPKKRYKYYLTPTGFTEKTRLTYQHLQNFTSLYRVARRDFSAFFNEIKGSNVERVAFCGVDEVTEIAYLSLTEAGLKLAGIVDTVGSPKNFFGCEVLPIERINEIDFDFVVITSFKDGDALKDALVSAGIVESDICDISAGGWMKKVAP